MMNKDQRKSVLGFNYKEKEYDERLALAIAQRFGLSEILSKLLAARNIDLEEIV